MDSPEGGTAFWFRGGLPGRLKKPGSMRSRPFVLAALVLAALVAAPKPAPAQSDESLTLIAGANQTGFFEILEYVAEYEGFFKEQHLHVDVQFANNPGNAAQIVASGKGDIVSTSLEPIIQGYERGLRLTAFFNRNPQYQWVLAVLADSPIRTLSDFKGTTLGEYTPSSPGEYSTNATLRGAGLKSSDYSYQVIGSGRGDRGAHRREGQHSRRSASPPVTRA